MADPPKKCLVFLHPPPLFFGRFRNIKLCDFEQISGRMPRRWFFALSPNIPKVGQKIRATPCTSLVRMIFNWINRFSYISRTEIAGNPPRGINRLIVSKSHYFGIPEVCRFGIIFAARSPSQISLSRGSILNCKKVWGSAIFYPVLQ